MNNVTLPIKFDSTSNGEFEPPKLSYRESLINERAIDVINTTARHNALNRRQFMLSASAAAATLVTANQINAMAGLSGGFYNVSEESKHDAELAATELDGDEFIFDIQGHFVDPNGRWLTQNPNRANSFLNLPGAHCHFPDMPNDQNSIQCLGPKQFIKNVFMDSDTDMMVLSFLPSSRESESLTIEEADATRRIIDELEGDQRLLLHGRVNPNQEGDIEGMHELAEKWHVSAWKTYTQWGPDGNGFFLDDEETGLPFIEKAISLGIKNICIHKGLPFGRQSYRYSLCDDIGRVAKRFPDVNFIIYHSGFETGITEKAFTADGQEAGVDSLIRSLLVNTISPNSNVYAELGSTWRFVMRHPDQAAHVLGKLIKYVGENNILWGTDSIWYGSPQDQIQAFRTFQISKEFQEAYGYEELTRSVKQKIFGLNAAKPYGIEVDEINRFIKGDAITTAKQDYLNNPTPHFQTYGPKTRRQFLNLKRWENE
ncbi:amidohydrolase family protein [Alteromonas sp. ASW11-130]|uniref:amidohydrolase family protein n=1 Tax=Alteromonas sp. ASW11-130 TaxID=3015775 RepID=UPI0022425C23|nr:amidohydrolase family protein [Alteromonas sp. ASW11-130]MCW8091239.1 amidohydrolase [Alteromonas sp. ASW11-130]